MEPKKELRVELGRKYPKNYIFSKAESQIFPTFSLKKSTFVKKRKGTYVLGCSWILYCLSENFEIFTDTSILCLQDLQ